MSFLTFYMLWKSADNQVHPVHLQIELWVDYVLGGHLVWWQVEAGVV